MTNDIIVLSLLREDFANSLNGLELSVILLLEGEVTVIPFREADPLGDMRAL